MCWCRWKGSLAACPLCACAFHDESVCAGGALAQHGRMAAALPLAGCPGGAGDDTDLPWQCISCCVLGPHRNNTCGGLMPHLWSIWAEGMAQRVSRVPAAGDSLPSEEYRACLPAVSGGTADAFRVVGRCVSHCVGHVRFAVSVLVDVVAGRRKHEQLWAVWGEDALRGDRRTQG